MPKIFNKYKAEAKIIKLNKFSDTRGSLNVLEFSKFINFQINRLFFTYKIPKNTSRGHHAHKNLYELVISIQGSLEIELSNGKQKKSFILDRNDKALLIPPLFWSIQKKHTPDNILLALCSEIYNDDDYIRDFDSYLYYISKEI